MQPTILVIEDNLELNRLFSKYLRSTGKTVVGLTSVAEAKYYLSQCNPPQVIILDLELADGNGTEILAMLQASPFDETRVVVVSGYAFSANNGPHPQDVDYTLLKPVDPRGLRALVETLS